MNLMVTISQNIQWIHKNKDKVFLKFIKPQGKKPKEEDRNRELQRQL